MLSSVGSTQIYLYIYLVCKLHAVEIKMRMIQGGRYPSRHEAVTSCFGGEECKRIASLHRGDRTVGL